MKVEGILGIAAGIKSGHEPLVRRILIRIKLVQKQMLNMPVHEAQITPP